MTVITLTIILPDVIGRSLHMQRFLPENDIALRLVMIAL